MNEENPKDAPENAPDIDEEENLGEGMSLVDHLDELRSRLIKCLYAVAAGFVICYLFAKQIFAVLMKPLTDVMPEGSSVIFTGLTEPFFTYLKVGFIAGAFAASPVILYQIWKFVAPGLHANERKLAAPFVILSTVFFLGGAAFGYFVVFPIGFEFFMSFASEEIRALPSMREFLSLAAKLMLAFGIVFEMPVFTFFLAKAGVIDKTFLKRKRKYALILVFVAAAVLTPPDVITQLLMAVPLVVLYEVSAIIAKIFGKPPMEDLE